MIERRNTAFARVWTVETAPRTPAELADALTGRGFVPGVSPEGDAADLHAGAGLADARFAVDGAGFRFLSLSSSRGNGCVVRVRQGEGSEPVPPAGRAAVRHPHLAYEIEAGGPSNSDRNLCENLAEALLVMTGGAVEIGGRGTKGNRPSVYTSPWLGQVKA